MRTPIATLAVLAGSLTVAATAAGADLVDDSYAELRLRGASTIRLPLGRSYVVLEPIPRSADLPRAPADQKR